MIYSIEENVDGRTYNSNEVSGSLYITFYFTRSKCLLTLSMSYFIMNNDCKVVFYYLNRKYFFFLTELFATILIHLLAILNSVALAGREIASSTRTSFTINVISHKTSVKNKQ